MKLLLLSLALLLAGLLPAQTIFHEGEITDKGMYIGKQIWHDSASGLLVAEAIYDPGGVLLSYKTWEKGDIMDAETIDPDRQRESLPEEVSKISYEEDGWGIYKFGTATGEQVQEGQKVQLMYKGWLQDGTVFDDSYRRGKPIKVATGKRMVVPGFERAILKLAPGEGAFVAIPAELAYRGRAIGTIPPFANLIFKIELQSVK